ncbi:MAG: hypothetical protein J6S85_20230, partial [Methanobrevibacter sp.]|nr:hypothetical protein [Methanobrevibacter sp.]
MLYLDAVEQWGKLNDEQAGKVIKALLQYGKSGKTPELNDKVVDIAFSFFAAQIDRDGEKWAQKCKRNAENYQRRKENSAHFSTIQHNSAIDTDTDTDT